MHYRLSFLAGDGLVLDACEAELETEDTAFLWMRLVGVELFRYYNWSSMELWCQGHCVIRLPAATLRT
jgi:hypothetical protein